MSQTDSELLEEMTRWLRILGIQEIKPVINRVLDFDEESKERSAKIAFELTDGNNSTRTIAKHIDFSYDWVSDRQQEWAHHGLVEKPARTSPYDKIISLTEIGIEVPGLDEILEDMENSNGGGDGE